MAKTIISAKWDIIPLEWKKLVKSALYGCLAVIAMVLATGLERYGLPDQLKYFGPFVPFVVNFLMKWAKENTYKA